MKLVISGIGRSATTLVYQQCAQMMKDAFKNTRFRYEPYLWSLNKSVVKGFSFGPGDVSYSGVYTHKETPLFLDDSHEAHDRFLEDILGNEAKQGDPETPDSWQVKVIRGTGRLESYIKKYPDIKIIACLRNPLDTVNSSLGMFSYLGDEFHEGDEKRFIQLLKEEYPKLASELPEAPSLTILSALWWRVFTDHTVKLAEKYPNNVFIFCHEFFTGNHDVVAKQIADFLGFSSDEVFRLGTDRPAGPKTTKRHLLTADVHQMYHHLKAYSDGVLTKFFTAQGIESIEQKLLLKYSTGEFKPQRAGVGLGQNSSIQLRSRILEQRIGPPEYRTAKEDDPTRLNVYSIVREELKSNPGPGLLELRRYKPFVMRAKDRLTTGCVITCYNNAKTIEDAVYSALDQSRPYDKIIVVNDASTDGSRQILEVLEQRYDSVSVINLNLNSGVSFARHCGIVALDTDLITQLDGDDIFWPTKNLEEARCFEDSNVTAAFSPICLVEKNKRRMMNTSAYEDSGLSLLRKMMSRTDSIPRDLTYRRSHYFEVGGYDLKFNLYEDWEFKIRLAALDGACWKESRSMAGTVYNRKAPGLSSRDATAHARALIEIFFKNVTDIRTRYRADFDKSVLQMFDGATAAHQRQITAISRTILTNCIEKPTLFALVAHRFTRSLTSSRNITFSESLKMFEAEMMNRSVAISTFGPGFDPPEGPYSNISDELIHWVTGETGSIQMKVTGALSGLGVDVYCHHMPQNNVTCRITEKATGKSVFEKQFILKKSDAKSKIFEPTRLELEAPLVDGEYTVDIIAENFVTAQVTGSALRTERHLYVAVADVAEIY